MKRNYTIRHPNLSDLPILVRLEAECWSEPLRASVAEIRQRLEVFPNSHYVLEKDGQVVGVIYSQRIVSAEALDRSNFREVSALYCQQGSIVQLLAVNVLPEMQNYGLGDQLLEFMLQYCTLQSGIERVVAVTLCKNYKNYVERSPMPMAEYIHQRNQLGQLVDPILHFHEAHGATIKKLIPGYRPEDVDNLGMGVLIEYDIHDRQRQPFGKVARVEPLQQRHQNESNESLSFLVEESIRSVLGQQHQVAFSPRRPLMEMGLDSLELLQLRALLSQRLGVELEPTFFFQYSTPAAITSYFQSLGSATGKEVEQSLLNLVPEGQEEGDLSKPMTSSKGFQSPDAFADEQSDVTGDAQKLVAIIGMGCRFPGGVNNSEEYWSLLQNGIDAIGEVPPSRWNLERYYDSNPEQPGKISTKYGGFLERVDQFDAQFFRIAPREATYIDPQQRVLLEVTWEALENAGLNPETLAGTDTGVFVGIFGDDYKLLQVKQNQEENFDAYFATGNSAAVASGRLSYFFGFTGPAISVDTACSSSLVAVHLACSSLLNGECNLALASGVNLLLSPENSITFSQSGMLSPDGRCKTFDASANGYVRSEGCGVVVLKRLSQAIADKDNILAVVRGTAINQDGASNGLTAPNGFSQEAVIQKALSVTRVSPNEVSYVETHGTGTPLGDPVEVKAIEAVYGKGRSQDNPLLIGSVKTNIGHAEAAAGIAGLIKVVLSMQNEYVPPHLHFQELNPHIALDRIPGGIPKEGMEWKRSQGKRRLAGVSSFGFSGTNAHVILEEAPALTPVVAIKERPCHLLTISTMSDAALRELVEGYVNFLGSNAWVSLGNVCFTANTGRRDFNHRLAVVAESIVQLREQLGAFATGEGTAGLVSGQVSSKSPKIAFLFTGQGSQYVGMGHQLYETQPTFRASIDRCDEILRPYLEKSLLNVLYPEPGETSPIDETAYTQPVLFALEYALAELWQSWGISPQVVMGHSVGEYVAACVAGVFSLEDGLKLIAARGRLMQALPEDGEMVAVFASEATVAAAIESYAQSVAKRTVGRALSASATTLSFAAINGPQSIVISGKSSEVQCVVATLEAAAVKTVKLNVSHAFHSPLMEPMLADFERIAKQVTYSSPRIDLISNVTGELATAVVATPEYWCGHIKQPVRFADGIETIHRAGYEVFVEIGPKATLLGMGRHCLPEGVGIWLASLHQGHSDWQQLLQSLAELYVLGVSVDWFSFDRDYPRCKVALPTYPFQRQSYWIDRQRAQSLFQEVKTPVVKLIHQGDTKQLSQQLESSTATTETSVDSEKLVKYYKYLSSQAPRINYVDEISENPEEYLVRFAPFRQKIPGFSWIFTFKAPEQHQEQFALVIKAQQEMRNALFRGVDFSALTKVLDIGCGYASDLIALGKQYPHLQLDGCNISPDQIEVGNERVRVYGLQNRINLYKLDSSKDEFPGQYDLAIGFQVIHHIQDKQGVFSNLTRHIHNGGFLILAEIISNINEVIAHAESSAYFTTKDEWAKLLARNHFRVVECVDTSHEIGNFLDDPNFDENWNRATEDADELTKAHLEGPHLLGGLLRKKLALYCLFTVQKDNYLQPDTILRVNQEKLAALVPYSQIFAEESESPLLCYGSPQDYSSPPRINGYQQKSNITLEKLRKNPPEERQLLLNYYLIAHVARVMDLTESKIDPHKPLNYLGLDSLMALDLRNRLINELEIDLSIDKFFLQGASISQLSDILFEQLALAALASSESSSNNLHDDTEEITL